MQYLDTQAVNDFFNPTYDQEAESERFEAELLNMQDLNPFQIIVEGDELPSSSIIEEANHIYKKFSEVLDSEYKSFITVTDKYDGKLGSWCVAIGYHDEVKIYQNGNVVVNNIIISCEENEYFAECYIKAYFKSYYYKASPEPDYDNQAQAQADACYQNS